MIQDRKTFVLCFALGTLAGAARLDAQEQQQTPPAAQNPAPATHPQKPAPATAPSSVDEYGYSTDGSLFLYYWVGPFKPKMRTGSVATAGTVADLDYPGNATKQSPGAVLTIPAGKNNALRFSVFRTQGSGNTTAGQDITVFDTSYAKGDYLAVAYTLRNAKVSFDYLSWPFPTRNKTFRIRTLWEVQYTTIQTAVDAPFKLDSSGTALAFAATKQSKSFFYPSFGVGLEKYLSRNIRWEAKGSGFAWPGKSQIWDAETDLAFKAGQLELVIGGKGFHFRTSKNDVLYILGTQYGGFAGIRWYPKF